MRRISVLVVDDHPVVHEGVRQLLGPIDRLAIVGEAQSGAEAIASSRRLAPDVVLLDARLPDMLVVEVIPRIAAASPCSKVVVFTAHATPNMLDDIRRLGVRGFVRKDCSPEQFVDVIVKVASGETVADVAPDDALRLAAAKLRGAALTSREYEVLRRVAMGESNAEIGRAIYLSPTTVKSYLQSALQKLEARNRVEAVAKLSELGLL